MGAMADKSLEEIFTETKVDPTVAATLLADGWTRESFAVSALDLTQFDQVLPELGGESLTLLQKACLRNAFKACQPPEPSAPAPEPSAPSSASPSGSWSEAFPPKLEPSVIQTMKAKYLAAYPSELLNNDTMPSTRLLSLVHSQLQKKHWVWVPWKLRLSVSRAEDLQGQRQQKAPKLEGLSLHSLLVDEVPSIEVSNGSMGLNAIRNVLELQDRAIALCGGAHMHNLKSYSQKFLSYLTQRVDSDTNLRTATVLESQAADKHVWSIIANLINDHNWNLDDALHEVTFIRNDLPSMLQLRPKMPKPLAPPGPSQSSSWTRPESKGSGKGKSKKSGSKGKVDGKGKPRVQWVTEVKQSDGSYKQLCMRFQVGKCQNAGCAFVHGCAFPTSAGVACGLPHGALSHQSTPH